MGKILWTPTSATAVAVEPAVISGRRSVPTNPAGRIQSRLRARARATGIGRPTTTAVVTPTTPTADTLTTASAAAANMDIGTCGTPKHRHQEFTTLNSLQLSQNHV